MDVEISNEREPHQILKLPAFQVIEIGVGIDFKYPNESLYLRPDLFTFAGYEELLYANKE